MRKLSTDQRTAILTALVEGCSINSTSRMTGASKITILRLLADAGTYCAQYHDLEVRNLQCERVQMDEIWSFVGCKDKARKFGATGYGSAWTWAALDPDSKLVISYMTGQRDPETANHFVWDVADRIDSHIQLSSDALQHYHAAVRNAFGEYVDYATIQKVFGTDRSEAVRYSPGVCLGVVKVRRIGNPDPAHVSTSLIERQNLSLRMSARRFTRLTNAFSKSIENHVHAVSLHYWFYNFARKHQTIKTTPAVAMGLADKPWTMRDLVVMIEAEEAKIGSRITDYLPSSRDSQAQS